MKRKRKCTPGLIKEMEDVLLLMRELNGEDQKDIARVIGHQVLAIEDCASMTEEQRSNLRHLQTVRRGAESESLCPELRARLGNRNDE